MWIQKKFLMEILLLRARCGRILCQTIMLCRNLAEICAFTNSPSVISDVTRMIIILHVCSFLVASDVGSYKDLSIEDTVLLLILLCVCLSDCLSVCVSPSTSATCVYCLIVIEFY